MPSVFGGRVGFKVGMGYNFPWGALETDALLGCRSGFGVARARATCELGFLLGKVVVDALLRVGPGP